MVKKKKKIECCPTFPVVQIFLLFHISRGRESRSVGGLLGD